MPVRTPYESTASADLLALAVSLERLDANLDSSGLARLRDLAHGRSLTVLAQALRDAADPAAIQSAAELLAANEGGCACSGDPPPEPTATQIEDITGRLARGALAPLRNNPAFAAELTRIMTDPR